MNCQIQTISELLKILSQNNFFELAIEQAQQKYKIKHFRVQKMKPHQIKMLLKKINRKGSKINLKNGKNSQKEQSVYTWAEGELKLYVWLLVGYLYVKRIDINQMNQDDFCFFAMTFNECSREFLLYQSKFLLKTSEKVLWKEFQAELLKKIIKEKFHEKNWNSVAYELFLRSDKQVFRTPKQCRERWLNHEDPIKLRSEWNHQQDIQLLTLIQNKGKKWSNIAKLMGSKRTQHMVKNRFTSLLRKAEKNLGKVGEAEMIQIIIMEKRREIKQESQKEKLSFSETCDSLSQEANYANNVQQVQDVAFNDYDVTKNVNQKQFRDQFPVNLVYEPTEEQMIEIEEGDCYEWQNKEKDFDLLNFFQKEPQLSFNEFLTNFF